MKKSYFEQFLFFQLPFFPLHILTLPALCHCHKKLFLISIITSTTSYPHFEAAFHVPINASFNLLHFLQSWYVDRCRSLIKRSHPRLDGWNEVHLRPASPHQPTEPAVCAGATGKQPVGRHDVYNTVRLHLWTALVKSSKRVVVLRRCCIPLLNAAFERCSLHWSLMSVVIQILWQHPHNCYTDNGVWQTKRQRQVNKNRGKPGNELW